jgi:hypothetical protein
MYYNNNLAGLEIIILPRIRRDRCEINMHAYTYIHFIIMVLQFKDVYNIIKSYTELLNLIKSRSDGFRR